MKALIELECNPDELSLKIQLEEMGISLKDTVEMQDFLRVFYCIASLETLSESDGRPEEKSCAR